MNFRKPILKELKNLWWSNPVLDLKLQYNLKYIEILYVREKLHNISKDIEQLKKQIIRVRRKLKHN